MMAGELLVMLHDVQGGQGMAKEKGGQGMALENLGWSEQG